MLGIATNVGSLTGQRNLEKSQGALSTALERLSSGLRINSAKDDAAGLAISERMTAQVRGLDQAARNANDAISVAQTAEGALSEASDVLQRMRDLSVQSANDTNSASDRASLQSEVAQLQAELNRIASATTFNGKNVLDGTFTNQSFQIGALQNQTISLSITSADANNIGNFRTTGIGGAATTINEATAGTSSLPAANQVAAQTLTLSGSLGSTTVAVGLGATANAIAASVNAKTSSTGVTATASTTATIGALSTTGTVSFNLTGDNGTSVAISAQVVSTSDLKALSDAINGFAATTGITATSSGATLTLTNSKGNDIGVENVAVGAAGTLAFTGGSVNSSGTFVAAGSTRTLTTGTTTDSSRTGGLVQLNSSSTFSVSSDTGTTLLQTTTVALSSVGSVNVGTQAGAGAAITAVDGALGFISSLRGTLGALQNRMNSLIGNLQNVSGNLSEARSRIRDADFASETANLTKGQISQQAGVAMLSQANSSPQLVLKLLQQ